MKAPTRLELIEYAVARVREGATRHEIVKEVRMLSEETRRAESLCMGIREAIDIVKAAERQAGVSR